MSLPATIAFTLALGSTGFAQRGFTRQIFQRLDQNGDGKITEHELDRPRLFQRLDADKSGGVTFEECRTFYRDRQLPRWMRQLPARLAELDERVGRRILPSTTWNSRPVVARTTDGTRVVASIRHHHGQGDDVAVVALRGTTVTEPEVLSAEKGQYVRPVLAAADGALCCLWTASEPERRSAIWFSLHRAGSWTPARRLLPDEARAHQNPEVAGDRRGRFAVAYQQHTGTGYDIHCRIWDGERWQAPVVLSDATSDDWDPALCFDPEGTLHVLWSGFRDGDYDIYWKRLPGDGAARRISARGEYDLHPSAAAARDGAVWAAWDVVRIPGHTSSGRTTITGANLRREVDSSGRRGARSFVQVKVLQGDTLRIPGQPRRQIRAPGGYLLAHCGLAKIALGAEPWIFYRVLRRNTNPWLPRGGIGYYWDLLGRPFRDGEWQAAQRFQNSDGYLEEAGLWAGPKGIDVVWGGERRRTSLRRARGAGADQAEQNHHGDFDNVAGCNGDVYLASILEDGAARPDAGSLRAASDLQDRDVTARRGRAGHEIVLRGRTYRLLWGDTHRHSNVSRCSAGAEPSPDDLYRYGADVCNYDFFALSDHAEHHRLGRQDRGYYYWWLQQKLADLYHVPESLSVLYNFEWTLVFPDGHHNTIFPGRPTVRLARDLARSSRLKRGWDLLAKRGVRAITIPHTGADPRMGTAWEIQDDRYQRLCEIFQSCRGSYEHAGCPREFTNTQNKKGFYWNALNKGFHVGVIASSDHGYGVAYACVYAGANTREAIWQAMWDRRTYGSTTYGLVLELRSGEHFMGECFKTKEAPSLQVYARGALPLRSIEILGRSSALHRVGSVGQPLGTREHRLQWTDPDWLQQDGEQWYYVRVIQVDDEMAWSSPIWVAK